jgi:phosphonate transport system substrate-binding protein
VTSTSFKRPTLTEPVARQNWLVIVVLTTLLFGAVVGGWLSLTSGRIETGRLVKLNLDETARDAPPAIARPPLRIAVAAMISPKSTYEAYEGLLARVGELLEQRVKLVQRRSYKEVNDLLEAREVDLAFVCAGPYVTGHDKFGLELLAAPVVHGKQVYYSYLIVHRENPVQSLDELRGQSFAFTDPDSNSGCLVPTYILNRKGETPRRFFGETFYSHSHDNSIRAVAMRRAVGAAVDSLIWEFYETIEPALTSQTRILLKSPPYGIPPLVVHPAMPTEQKQNMQKVFLSLHRDSLAREHLRRLQIDRFDRVDDRAYDSVREMEKWVRSRREKE